MDFPVPLMETRARFMPRGNQQALPKYDVKSAHDLPPAFEQRSSNVRKGCPSYYPGDDHKRKRHSCGNSQQSKPG